MMRIARGVARHGFEVHAAFPCAEDTTSMVRDCEAAGICHRPFEWNPSKQLARKSSVPIAVRQFLWFLQMRSLLKAVRPDVVQLTAGSWSEVLVPSLSCALFRIPTLVVFQGTGRAKTGTRLPAAWVRALAWARARRQRWMAVSLNNLTTLQAIFRTRTDEIGILPNGIEILSVPGGAESEVLRRDVRSELALPPSAKILLTTGRLVRAKGYADLLSIASLR